MTLKQAEELRIQNLAHTLRMPKFLQSLDEEEKAQLTNIRFGVCYVLKKLGLGKDVGLDDRFLIRCALRTAKGVYAFFGEGSPEYPYTLKTKWGSGKFYNARHLFKNKQYPWYINKFYCFSNCYYMAKDIGETNLKSCKVLSGIAFIKDCPILHSVIETEDGWIVDFNYDIYMQKDLYFNVFAFEKLGELSSQEIYDKDRLLNQYFPYLYNYGHGYRVFALDDLLHYAKQREHNEVEERPAIENF